MILEFPELRTIATFFALFLVALMWVCVIGTVLGDDDPEDGQ